MGIKDLFTPYVRDSTTATNTTLKDLKNQFPSKDWVGIDMSIILISTIKSSPNIIDALFAEPKRPIESLNDKVCDFLALFVNAGFNILCCFDGKAGPLKTNHAYLSRYGNN